MITMSPRWAPMLTVARALEEIGIKPVFVGGLVAGLLVTDPAAPRPRPTDDIDLIVEALTHAQYHLLGEQLRRAGFAEDEESKVMCRWRYEGHIVDIMPTSGEALSMSSRWFPEAYASGHELTFDDGRTIWTVTAPFFLALKIEAFRDRGDEDYMASHDLEDIIAVVDGREELLPEMDDAPADLRAYLAEHLTQMLETPPFIDALPGHLAGDEDRQPIVEQRLRALASG